VIDTRWNSQPCDVVRGSAVVKDAPEFPQYWAREHVGQRRRVAVVFQDRQWFVLDDEDGSGWVKVTNGGGPRLGHRDLAIDWETFRVVPPPPW
jgi:hypothetical protein